MSGCQSRTSNFFSAGLLIAIFLSQPDSFLKVRVFAKYPEGSAPVLLAIGPLALGA